MSPGRRIADLLACAAQFRAHQVPASAVQPPREDWLKSEIIRANGLAAALDHPSLGAVEMPGVAAKLERTPGAVKSLPALATDDQIAAFAAVPAPRPPEAARKSAPLAGVRVLDLGTVIAGAYAASILANFGADVVKVESPDGDPFRSGGGGFINYNRGKRGLGLDLKAAKGRALFLDLAKGADVVLDNYRLGVREQLGVDHAALEADNPHASPVRPAYLRIEGLRRHGQPGFDAGAAGDERPDGRPGQPDRATTRSSTPSRSTTSRPPP